MENTKQELMLLALQQRIGEITANYEVQIASLRADLTQMMKIDEAANTTADTDTL